MTVHNFIQKHGRWLLLIAVWSYSHLMLTAQSENVTSKKVYSPTFLNILSDIQPEHSFLIRNQKIRKNYSIMLPPPDWGHTSPLFCRLEDKINEGNQLQCLFRLGSVSYVNYLEQKGDHQRLLLEQLR